MKHLRPFAERGAEVTEADIRGFFDARIQELQRELAEAREQIKLTS